MAASFLLRLQRGSGNRYVQDVISRARSGSAESPARGRRPQPAGLDVGGMVSAALQQAIARARHGGRRLDPGTAAELGGALGRDVSQVRVHDDGQADRLSRSLDAAAFTVGSDIFFRARHYDPGTTPGRRLLAHELAHAVQQHAGPRSAYRYRLASAGDPGERAADRAAEDIIGRGRAQPAAVPPVVPLIQRKAFIGRNPMSARPAEFGDPPLRTPGSLEEGADSPRARRQADDLPPLKRPKREVIPPEDSDLGLGDRNLAVVLKDNRSRYFRTRSELYRFAGGQTDDIGYVDREKVWARLPDDFLVLGENHARTTVMDLVEATSIKKYVYEGSEARPSPYLYPRSGPMKRNISWRSRCLSSSSG